MTDVERKRAMWGSRMVRNGAVRFDHRIFRVAPTIRRENYGDPKAERQYWSDPPYDGRLDGKRFWFYRYEGSFPDSIFLHSTDNDEWPGPNCIDGFFVWEQWTCVSQGAKA